MQGGDNRYDTIDRAVNDMADGVVELQGLAYVLAAFVVPLAVGMLALAA